MRFLVLFFPIFLLSTAIVHGQTWDVKDDGVSCYLVTNWFRSENDFTRVYKIEFESWKGSPERSTQPQSPRRYKMTFTVSNPGGIAGFDSAFFWGPYAPAGAYKLLALKAKSKAGKEETILLPQVGGNSAEMEGAFFFQWNGADETVVKLLRRISEGYETFSLSVLSPDQNRKEPLISVTCDTTFMHAAVKKFLDGCSNKKCCSVPATK